jgi:prepilin-type N-terminal cleavage/methylation domain-containing protein
MRSSPRSQSGFTLIEILVAVSISAMAIGVVTYFTLDLSAFGVDLGNRLEGTREVELTLRTMLSEIRSMGPGANGAYPIATATSTTFAFYSNIDSDSGFEHVRYFLEGGVIKKGVIEPVGNNPPTYPPANEVIREMAHYITSTGLFLYYAEGYPDEIGALASPVNIPNIRMVKITASTDKDASRPPLPLTLSITATIRNLRGEI